VTGVQTCALPIFIVPGDEPRITGGRGDEAIETLAEVADGHGVPERRTADWKIKIQQLASRIVDRQPALPPPAGMPGQVGIRTVGLQPPKPLPGSFREQVRVVLLFECGRHGTRGLEHAPRRIRGQTTLPNRFSDHLRAHSIAHYTTAAPKS